MVDTLLRSVLIGFGLYSVFFISIGPIFSGPTKLKIEKFDNSACSFIPVIGVVYLLNWLGILIVQYTIAEEPAEIYQLNNRVFGPYWFGYWLQPFLFLSSQLLWFKKLRKMISIRIIIALTLIVSIQSLIVYLRSMDRQYLPSSWTVPLLSRMYDWILSIGIFVSITALFQFTTSLWKSKNDH